MHSSTGARLISDIAILVFQNWSTIRFGAQIIVNQMFSRNLLKEKAMKKCAYFVD
jgi:hypothetical protein